MSHDNTVSCLSSRVVPCELKCEVITCFYVLHEIRCPFFPYFISTIRSVFVVMDFSGPGSGNSLGISKTNALFDLPCVRKGGGKKAAVRLEVWPLR